MTDLEIEYLSRIANDEVLIKTLEKLFDEEIETNRPGITGTDEEIGQNYKAYLTAKNLLAKGLNKIKSYHQGRRPEDKINRGR